jgi:hypothetical protein
LNNRDYHKRKADIGIPANAALLMIKNYIKIAWRNILHNKGYSLINISGLSIGLAIVILISCWIRDELLFNRNFPHYDRLVKVMQNSTHNNVILTNSCRNSSFRKNSILPYSFSVPGSSVL